MVHHVTLTMPDDLYQALLRRTQETGRGLEETAADCLAQALRSPAPGELLRSWTGAWASGVPDASIRHDDYLGQALSPIHKENHHVAPAHD
jgi:hypothetical protein